MAEEAGTPSSVSGGRDGGRARTDRVVFGVTAVLVLFFLG